MVYYRGLAIITCTFSTVLVGMEQPRTCYTRDQLLALKPCADNEKILDEATRVEALNQLVEAKKLADITRDVEKNVTALYRDNYALFEALVDCCRGSSALHGFTRRKLVPYSLCIKRRGVHIIPRSVTEFIRSDAIGRTWRGWYVKAGEGRTHS